MEDLQLSKEFLPLRKSIPWMRLVNIGRKLLTIDVRLGCRSWLVSKTRRQEKRAYRRAQKSDENEMRVRLAGIDDN